ncbi:MAG: hypothetical protein HY401_09970 [Elusimicrobia bacterium]|nr:hypothetical protein [Elusimicrobiota bacterium]
MKYMESGGFQNHPLMRLTLTLTVLFLAGLWVTNALLYFSKMSLFPSSVTAYYLGSENQFTMPRTYQSMLETSHMHFPMMGLVILMLTHLLIFAPFNQGFKTAFIITAFSSALLGEISGWLIRFAHPGFAYLKIACFVVFESALAFLLAALIWFLRRGRKHRGKILN